MSDEAYKNDPRYIARVKWADFLVKKERKKATGVLDAGKGERCCLGHACYTLDIKKTSSKKAWNEMDRIDDSIMYLYGESEEGELAPRELVNMLGLLSCSGELIGSGIFDRVPSFKYDANTDTVSVIFYDEETQRSFTTFDGDEETEKTSIGIIDSLATLNDDSGATPQAIGRYIRTVLRGGPHTPFKYIE